MDITKILLDLGVAEDVASKCNETITGELYKSFIPKSQYNKKAEEFKTLEAKMKELEIPKVEEPKQENPLELQLKELMSKIEKIEAEKVQNEVKTKKEQVKQQLIEKGLNEKTANLILKSTDVNGDVQEIVTNLVEEYKEFIPTESIVGTTPTQTVSTGSSNGAKTYTKDELSRMSENDIASLMETDPNFFDRIQY